MPSSHCSHEDLLSSANVQKDTAIPARRQARYLPADVNVTVTVMITGIGTLFSRVGVYCH